MGRISQRFDVRSTDPCSQELGIDERLRLPPETRVSGWRWWGRVGPSGKSWIANSSFRKRWQVVGEGATFAGLAARARFANYQILTGKEARRQPARRTAVEEEASGHSRQLEARVDLTTRAAPAATDVRLCARIQWVRTIGTLRAATDGGCLIGWLWCQDLGLAVPGMRWAQSFNRDCHESCDCGFNLSRGAEPIKIQSMRCQMINLSPTIFFL